MSPHTRLIPWGVSCLALMATGHAAAVNLPVSSALPPGSSTTRGFVVRVAQAPVDATAGNNGIRAYKQINGTLADSAGKLISNVAFAGPEAGGGYAVDTINFEKDGNQIDLIDLEQNSLGSFTSQTFPGIPGSDGTTDKFAVEVVGFLDLKAGDQTFAISVTAERTDINDDDGFQVFVARNPRDFFGQKVAEYQRVAPGFQNNWRNENQFTVNAPQAGIYPFRILYWQTGSGCSLDFYTVDSASGARVLVNDPSNTDAVKSYRDSKEADANAPYLAEASPAAGSEGNSAAAPIEALIIDGATTVDTAKVKMTLNGASVTPQSLTKANGKISVVYNPNATRTTVNNAVVLEYTDSASVARSAAWNFGIVTSGGSTTEVAGQWDFNSGDLSATVGKALTYLNPAFDGPTGTAEDKTKFGTTADFGIANIGSSPDKVLRVPGTLTRDLGYVVDHGIKPNGGGTRVNQYTLIMDVYVAETGPGAASLWQVSSPANTDDGDLFWQGNNFGQGGGGYNGRGTFTAGKWHRVVAAYDMAATPPVVVKYVDGIKQDDWTANQGLDNPRRSMGPTAILFGDGDQDERREMWVNSIQIRNGRISDAEAFLLGAPSADGIPQKLATANVTGQWDFQYGDLGASIGASLQYLDPAFDGPSGTAEDKTTFGTTTELNVAAPGGVETKVMRVPGTLKREIGYKLFPRIAPNGGGTRVNQYTLIMDVFVAETGPGAASLWQVSSPNNTDDGDLFWQGNNFGQGGGGYNGRGTFTAGKWHRVVAAYDMAATPPVVVKYVDGVKQDDWTANQSLDNPRRSIGEYGLLFADGDQDERREMFVRSVQMRSGRLSDVECALLGAASADGIPVLLPSSSVTGHWDFEFADLGASVGSNLAYLDPAFDGPQGTAEDKTAFGTTTALGIPGIGAAGQEKEAAVMRVPGTLKREIGYKLYPRIAPNGGGTRVNQYTLIMDVFVAETGPGAASLWQVSSPNNTDDGDLFWQGNNFGQGGGGYNGTGQFTAGAWHRVCAAYDMAATPPVVVKVVDGIFQDNWTANQSLDNPRRSIGEYGILFADGDQDERREMWVNSVQIRAGALTREQMEALGGPSAGGIPLLVAAPAAPASISVKSDSNGNVVITFTGVLQQADTINGTFAPVVGATSPLVMPKANLAAGRYFRATN